MYQHLLIALALASGPAAAAALPQTSKPAPAEKSAGTAKPKPADAGQKSSKGVRTVEIIGTDDMKYSVTSIPAKPGEQLRIRLVVKGSMPKIAMAHNVVVLDKGTGLIKFVQAGAAHRATDFIPPDMKDQVIAATAMAGAGETVEVTFKVPAAAGEYPFICTFPGHFQAGMRGTLNVK